MIYNVHTCTYIHTGIDIHTCIHDTPMYVYMYACKYICMYICIYVCVCVYVCTCIMQAPCICMWVWKNEQGRLKENGACSAPKF